VTGWLSVGWRVSRKPVQPISREVENKKIRCKLKDSKKNKIKEESEENKKEKRRN
jgi:hypothetical protein